MKISAALALSAALCAPAFAQDQPPAPVESAPAPAEAAPAPAEPPPVPAPAGKLAITPGSVLLIGPDSVQQAVVMARFGDQAERDVTREATLRVEPAGIAAISETGYLTPLGNGTAEVIAELPNAEPAKISVRVEHFETPQPISFRNDVVPLFTRHGCNGGGCHGKAEGQNGFRLSLLGFEPEADYEYLLKEGRGRRVFPASPEHSLLIMKGAGDLPHGGGARLEHGTYDYGLLVRWMRSGMPYGPEDEPTVERIEVFPPEILAQPKATQQLLVTAFYTDGSSRDATRAAQFESNQKEMAEVSPKGLVEMAEQTGTASVMIRYNGQVAVFRATIPLGAPVESLPEPRNLIDGQIFAKLKTLGLPPSPEADDATFLRRVTLDIAGRLPTIGEATAFAADGSADKRQKKIAELLGSMDYAEFFANKWAGILRNKRNGDNAQRGTYAFYQWIRDSFYNNKPYDEFTSEIVAASGEVGANPPVNWYRVVRDQKDQLQDVAQVFLGVRLQCAQCHHHPYERWSQDDYYGFAAFFSRIGRKPGVYPGEELVFHNPGGAGAQNPKSGKSLKPTALMADPLELGNDDDPREKLAEWMGKPDNPFFAKMLVNRYWKHFFGRGLVEPEDDIRVTNPATHPALLNELSDQFAKGGYDLKKLIATICESRTYQLSAEPNEYNANDRQNYSRYYPKRLQAEILLDSINVVSRSQENFQSFPQGERAVALPDDAFNAQSYFLTVFGRPEMDSACECERTADANLAQSLHLLNSKSIQDKLTNGGGRAAALFNDKERSEDDRLRELYLAAFSREPRAEELAAAKDYLAKKRAKGDEEGENKGKGAQFEREGWEDIVWAIVNTKEFLFNH